MIGCGSMKASLKSKLLPIKNPQLSKPKIEIPTNIVVEETYAAPDQKTTEDRDLKTKTFVKQVLKLPAFGCLLQFNSLQIILELHDRPLAENNDNKKNTTRKERGKRLRNKTKFLLKVDIGNLKSLMGLSIEGMMKMLKKAIVKKDDNEFEINFDSFTPDSFREMNIEKDFPDQSHIENIDIDSVNYNISLK